MTKHAKRLTGHVATILNAYALAIDIGKEKGVNLKMRFAVLSAEPIEIRDPISKEVLDTYEPVKARVEVTEVRELVAICQTYRTQWIPGATLSNMFPLVSMWLPRETVETLSIQDADLPSQLSEEESFVKPGDRVVQLDDDENDDENPTGSS